MKTKNPSPQTLDAATAKRWHCSLRTARRWRADGCPITDPDATRQWLASQKLLPPGTRKVLDAAQRKPARRRNTTPTSQDTGAAAALSRLETAERDAFARFEAAVAANDIHLAKSCRGHWLSIADQLRKYDETLGAERREHDVLPKREAMDAVSAVTWTVALHLKSSLLAVVHELRRAHNDGEAVNLMRQVVDRLMAGTVAVVEDGTHMQTLKLSPWAARAVRNGLENRFGAKTDAVVAGHLALIEDLFAALAKREAEAGLKLADEERQRQRTLLCEAYRYAKDPPAWVSELRRELNWQGPAA